METRMKSRPTFGHVAGELNDGFCSTRVTCCYLEYTSATLQYKDIQSSSSWIFGVNKVWSVMWRGLTETTSARKNDMYTKTRIKLADK